MIATRVTYVNWEDMQPLLSADDLRAENARLREENESLRQDVADLQFMAIDLVCANGILRRRLERLTRREEWRERGRG